MTDKEIHIASTPASRWIQKKKKDYWYMFAGGLIFIGLFSLIFSKAFGIGLFIIASIMRLEQMCQPQN